MNRSGEKLKGNRPLVRPRQKCG